MVITIDDADSLHLISFLEQALDNLKISKKTYLSICDSFRSFYEDNSFDLSSFESSFNKTLTNYECRESALLRILSLLNPNKSYKE